MGWKDRAVPVTAGKSSWKDRATPVEIAPLSDDPSQSPITAATTGLIQGAVPFAGAIAGAGHAALDAITGVRGPLAPGGKVSDIVDDYRQARDSFTSDAKKAARANPGTALASNVVGGIANPLFRGADSLPKVLGASGVQALGMSDSDLTQGQLKDAAVDAGIGVGAGALGYGIGKAIPKALQFGKWFGKKALTNLGPSSEAIEARLAGKAQDTAKNYPEIAEEMGATLDDLSSQMSKADTEAWNTLSKDASIPKAYVTSPLDEAISELKLQGQTIGGADKQAERVLASLQDDLGKLGDNVSEADLKSIIQKLDSNINWDDPASKTVNDALKGIRSHFDDTLKFQNSNYKKAMEPVSSRMQVLQDLKRKFGFSHKNTDGFKPSDSTATSLKSSLNENRAVTQENLEKLKGFTGKDFYDQANDYRLAQQFAVKSPQASTKKSFIGGALGSLAGGPLGAGLGAVAGGTADAFGGKAVGKLIDSYLKAGNSAAFGKFKPVIEKAAEKGPEALAMISSILANNPEFKKAINLEEPSPSRNRTLGSTK